MADAGRGLDLEGLLGLHIWRDGEILGPDAAAISVWDHAFLYGDGVFEGIRLRGGALYRGDLHLQRLRRSSRLLALDVRHSDEEIFEGIRSLAVVNDLRDAHVRIIHSRGVGLPGIDPRRCPQTSLSILLYPFPPLLGTEPISLITSSVVRKAPRSVPAGAKSLNYLDSILAKQQATDAGAGDALMLDGNGNVAEATGANLFAVADGQLKTPPVTAALPGITRRTVLELAEALGIPSAVETLSLGDLYVADEAFLTGTAAGIVPIAKVDGHAVTEAPGPLTKAIDERYRETWTDPRYVREVV
jgi:branched-chain amino acid aminotransferase